MAGRIVYSRLHVRCIYPGFYVLNGVLQTKSVLGDDACLFTYTQYEILTNTYVIKYRCILFCLMHWELLYVVPVQERKVYDVQANSIPFLIYEFIARTPNKKTKNNKYTRVTILFCFLQLHKTPLVYADAADNVLAHQSKTEDPNLQTASKRVVYCGSCCLCLITTARISALTGKVQ